MTITEMTGTRPAGTECATLVPRDRLPLKLAAYAGIHDAILRDLSRLERLARRGERAGVIDRAGLRRWWAQFTAGIEHHHEREDDLLFPMLIERGVTLDLAGLTADHDVLDGLMAAVHDGLAGTDPIERLAVTVAALLAHMDDHLAREEQQLFGPIDALFSSEEYADLEAEMRAGMSVRDLAFTLPWILDDLHPRLLGHLVAEAPAPLRLMNRLFWARSYAKIAAPVLAVAR